MNPYIKQLWSTRLCSGVPQQQGRLSNENNTAFCCLGDLCEIFRQETGRGQWVEGKFDLNGEIHNYLLPQVVAEWAGLPEASPKIRKKPLKHRGDIPSTSFLSCMNDDGYNKLEIAQFIRAEL